MSYHRQICLILHFQDGLFPPLGSVHALFLSLGLSSCKYFCVHLSSSAFYLANCILQYGPVGGLEALVALQRFISFSSLNSGTNGKIFTNNEEKERERLNPSQS